MNDLQEQMWIDNARQGDQAAFEQLVRLYEKRVFALTLRMCRNPEDAVRILQHTKADMAMVGRGCFGNPWLFQQAQAALEGRPIPPLPPLAERCDTAVRQIELAVQTKGERVAVLEARRHYCWYLKGVPHSGYYKEKIVQMNTLEDVYQVTKGIKRDLT